MALVGAWGWTGGRWRCGHVPAHTALRGYGQRRGGQEGRTGREDRAERHHSAEIETRERQQLHELGIQLDENHSGRVSYSRSSSYRSRPAWRQRKWRQATAARPPRRPSARHVSAPAGQAAGPAGTQSAEVRCGRPSELCKEQDSDRMSCPHRPELVTRRLCVPGPAQFPSSLGATLPRAPPTPRRSTHATGASHRQRHLPLNTFLTPALWGQLPPPAPLTVGGAARPPPPPCASSALSGPICDGLDRTHNLPLSSISPLSPVPSVTMT